MNPMAPIAIAPIAIAPIAIAPIAMKYPTAPINHEG
jgi:hypothetical protein